jgi:hypothetical protein
MSAHLLQVFVVTVKTLSVFGGEKIKDGFLIFFLNLILISSVFQYAGMFIILRVPYGSNIYAIIVAKHPRVTCSV